MSLLRTSATDVHVLPVVHGELAEINTVYSTSICRATMGNEMVESRTESVPSWKGDKLELPGKNYVDVAVKTSWRETRITAAVDAASCLDRRNMAKSWVWRRENLNVTTEDCS